MSNRKKYIGIMMLGAVMISFSPVFVKLADVGPSTSAFYRLFIGGIILFGVSLIRGHKLWKGWYIFGYTIMGGFFFAADLFLWHRSILYIGPGLATIIGNFQVFCMALVGIFYYKEEAGWKLWTSIPVALFGLFLIIGDQWYDAEANYRLGIWLGLATAVSYTFYLLTVRKSQMLGEQFTAEANMAYISIFSAAFILPSVLMSNHESLVIPTMETAVILVALALVGQVFGWILFSHALPKLDTSVSGLILLLQPALAFIWDILIFARPAGWKDLLGATIALGAIYLGSISKNR